MNAPDQKILRKKIISDRTPSKNALSLFLVGVNPVVDSNVSKGFAWVLYMSRVLVLLLSVLMSPFASAATEAQSDFEAIKSLPMLMVYQMGGKSITPVELKAIAQKRVDEITDTLRYLDNEKLKDIASREKAEWVTILNVAEKVEAESALSPATAERSEIKEGDI